jgi:hypothetical protein
MLKYAFAALAGFACSVMVWWLVGGNSVVMQQQRMGDQIAALQQRISDLQKQVQVDQDGKITSDHDRIVEVEDKVRWIMEGYRSIDTPDYHPPARPKKTP